MPDPSPWLLDCRGRRLDCRPGRTHVMGILNVTPDSFSDGGRYLDPSDALRRAAEMTTVGATIIDVGGESTRPAGQAYGEGAAVVEAEDERRRILPVIEAIAQDLPEVIVSVDTYKPEVAQAALEAGAHVVNDVTGLRHGDDLARTAADAGAPIVVMHGRGIPGAMPHETASDTDVVEEVIASLRRSVETAEAAGVTDILVDPGFGFGKSTADNLRLVAETDRLREALGRPVLVGASRKSSIGAALRTAETPAPVSERLYGSLGLAALAALRGASIVRVHDVRETAETLRVIAAAEAARTASASPVSA